MSIKEINDILDVSNPLIKKNLKVVSSKEFKYPYLLHISTNRQQKLTPNVSTRRMNDEDNTFPRIHCSTTLLGCIIGYGAVIDNHLWTSKEFKGGYYIHFIEFDYCGIPNSNLTPDRSESDEHWLFSYNKETVTYPVKDVGKMFVTELVRTNEDKNPVYTLIIYVEVPKNATLPINDEVTLTEGIHKLKYENRHFRSTDKNIETLTVINQLDSKEYKEAKTDYARKL
jgi:hypothetical protein